jgi:hypothetical protein
MLQRDVYLKKVFMTAAHSCSLWFRAQELNEDWCFEHTVTRIYSQLQMSEQWHPVAYWL